MVPIHNLLKCDPIELAVKELDFLHVVVLAANEVALPCQRQLRVLRPLQRALELLELVRKSGRNGCTHT